MFTGIIEELGTVDAVQTRAAGACLTKMAGGLEALPLAGGIGRRRRADAIRIQKVAIPQDEFAIGGYFDVHRDY